MCSPKKVVLSLATKEKYLDPILKVHFDFARALSPQNTGLAGICIRYVYIRLDFAPLRITPPNPTCKM